MPTERVLDVLRGLPGVAAASASTTVPNAATGPRQLVAADATGTNGVIAERGAITATFFATLGVPMRAGRAFSDEDSSATRSAIVNEALARRLFGGRDPIGSRVYLAGSPFDVVGVVADYVEQPAAETRAGAAKCSCRSRPSRKTSRTCSSSCARTAIRRRSSRPIRREIRDSAEGRRSSPERYTLDQILAVMGQEVLARHGPALPAHRDRHAADNRGNLRCAGVRHHAAIPGAGGAHRGRGERHDSYGWSAAMRCGWSPSGSLLGVGVTFGSRASSAQRRRWQHLRSPVQAFIVPVLIVVVIGALATWVPSRRALHRSGGAAAVDIISARGAPPPLATASRVAPQRAQTARRGPRVHARCGRGRC